MTAIASSAVNLCDGTIRYDRSSESDSVVVLLHGGGLDNARLSWRHLLPALADVHRVYAPDWPKHGSSRPWRGIVDQAGLERCLGHLLDRWGLRSVALVGVSMGASAALGFTLAHPERVDRLVLLDPGGLQESVRMHLLSYLAVQAPWPRLTALALRPWVLRRLIQRSTFATPPADVEEIAAGVIEELRAKRNRSPYSDWQRCEIGPHRMKVNSWLASVRSTSRRSSSTVPPIGLCPLRSRESRRNASRMLICTLSMAAATGPRENAPPK